MRKNIIDIESGSSIISYWMLHIRYVL